MFYWIAFSFHKINLHVTNYPLFWTLAADRHVSTQPLSQILTLLRLRLYKIFLLTVWPSEEDMEQSVQVKASDVTSQLVTQQWMSQDVCTTLSLNTEPPSEKICLILIRSDTN